jgi:fumarate hydratase class I
MSDKPFFYQDPFQLGPDTTEYELITSDHVSISEFEGKPVLKIAPEALTVLAAEAIKGINFTLRASHLAQVAAILDDPEASETTGWWP